MRDFIKGVGMFGQAAAILLRRPKLLLLGALPAILTALLLLGGIVALIMFSDDLAASVTPFADDWSDGPWTAMRVAAAVALVAAGLVIGQLTFAVLTLIIGGPFYELIAEKVEDSFGDPPSEVELSWGRLLWLGIVDGLRLVLRSLGYTVPLIPAGFIPVVGQTVVPVLMALVTAWFLALELVSVSFYRRGMDFTKRREVLAKRRGLAIGLGLPASLLCAIPLLAIVVMPIAFVGGVLIAREAFRTLDAPRPAASHGDRKDAAAG